MAKKATFQLDLRGGAEVLQNMAMKQVANSTRAIASRANDMGGGHYSVSTTVGVIRRGQRAIGTVTADSKNPKAYDVLRKATDAGKV